MRLLLQRVTSASVMVADREISRIGRGLLVLVGIEDGDDRAKVDKAVAKLFNLRCFEDADGRMNLSIAEVNGDVLLVSQFTLAASLTKGRRPSFIRAARPEIAEPLVEALAAGLHARGVPVATGEFGAHMAVSLVNDGPVTFVLDL